ncbi:reverse transcriptase family protein [Orbus wheelerorum]|uniref:reverse transcriptase family protein n=1 Tax=Orbus wheelerorum TaxID=3074111 RepID=UPI00370DA8E1
MMILENNKKIISFINDKNHNRTEQYSNFLKKYCLVLHTKNLPIILDNEHLSNYLSLNISILNKISTNTHKYYRQFSIPKRRGGARKITAPYPLLINIQKWILDNILNFISTHDYVYSYKKNKSIVDNAKHHIGNPILFKFDIKNFFGSIHIINVKKMFYSFGYSNHISQMLADLCCLDDFLPQGACTSPMISNIILYDFDNKMDRYVTDNYNGKYSRYADDITISGQYLNYGDLLQITKKYLNEYTLFLNESKTKRLNKKRSKIVTGLLVKETTVRVTKKYRHQFRRESFLFFERYKNENLYEELIKNPFLTEKLIGKATFILNIEPQNIKIKEIKDRLIKIHKEIMSD